MKTLIERAYFEDLIKKILSSRKPGEHFYFSLASETSQFVRINASRVRQLGVIEDASLSITFMTEVKNRGQSELREATRSITLTGLAWKDQEEVSSCIHLLRNEVPGLPPNPFAQLPQDFGSSSTESKGELLDFDHAVESLLVSEVSKLDLAGIYAAGPIVRGMANSAGQFLWFATETFSFDYSLYTKSQRAIKSLYAGKNWEQDKYLNAVERASSQLVILECSPKKLERGSYRTYLSPACLDDILQMFSWGAMSEAAIRQGESSFRLLRSGERSFSPLLNITEDFSNGQVPRFNSLGEIASEVMPLIENGKLKNSFISARTAKEYGLTSNGASAQEGPRSPVIHGGSLPENQILSSLGTGLYLSNLHYLNWSDQSGGRITGMTRYACFWVENGKIIAPIENMRWDDSVFSLLGSELEALTETSQFNASVSSYEGRSLGGSTTPGALLKKMTFTI